MLEDSGCRHQHVGAGIDRPRTGRFVDTAVYFQVTRRVSGVNAVPNFPYLMQHGRDKFLTGKSGINGHGQHHVQVGEYTVQRVDRRSWVQGHSGLLAVFLYLLDHTMQVRNVFLMDDDNICPCIDKVAYVPIRVFDHEMSFDQQIGVRTKRFDHHRSHRDVGDEMPVHHIDMNTLGAGDFRFFYCVFQIGKIRGQDRWGYVNHVSCSSSGGDRCEDQEVGRSRTHTERPLMG